MDTIDRGPETLADRGDVWWLDGDVVRDENRLAVPAREIIARIRRLQETGRYLTPAEELELESVEPTPLDPRGLEQLLERIRDEGKPARTWRDWTFWVPVFIAATLLIAAPVYWWWTH